MIAMKLFFKTHNFFILGTILVTHTSSESIWFHLCLDDVISATKMGLKHVTPLLDELDHQSGFGRVMSP